MINFDNLIIEIAEIAPTDIYHPHHPMHWLVLDELEEYYEADDEYDWR